MSAATFASKPKPYNFVNGFLLVFNPDQNINVIYIKYIQVTILRGFAFLCHFLWAIWKFPESNFAFVILDGRHALDMVLKVQ